MLETKTMRNTCLILTAIAGIFFISQSFDIQGFLSTGDHGRDLYAFERTLHGDIAYQDYWWVYGPLMPFYYALFMKFYGTSILSVLLAKAIIKFSTGIFIFIAINLAATPIAGLMGALWYYLFSQDFFFTYNHIGGILCISIIAAMLTSYLKLRHKNLLWCATATAFILAFIKINFGLAAFAAIAAAKFITDRLDPKTPQSSNALFYRLNLIYAPIVVLMAYYFFLNGLSIYEIRQCMPYANSDQPYNTLPWIALANYWSFFTKKFFTSPIDFFFGSAIIIALIRTAYLAIHRKLSNDVYKRHLIALFIMAIFFCCSFHEYLKSGVWYRSLWVQPVEFIFLFTLISLALYQTGKRLQMLVWGFIAILMVMGWHSQSTFISQLRHDHARYMADGKLKTIVTNDPSWIKTVEDTARFLSTHLAPDDQMFALPYDAIYYYLAGKKSPTQLLIYFEHINIPPEQEQRVIKDLETKNVNWVVVSSRMNAREHGLGQLGITYCPRIGKYLQENFVSVAQFGDWKNEPGWGWNHGTIILQRKNHASKSL